MANVDPWATLTVGGSIMNAVPVGGTTTEGASVAGAAAGVGCCMAAEGTGADWTGIG